MANLYNSTTLTATKYYRCGSISISNPLEGTPMINLHEEEVLDTGDGGTPIVRPSKRTNRLSVAYDPTLVIQERNPDTGELTGGSFTLGDMYGRLYSMYIQKAMERDAQVV